MEYYKSLLYVLRRRVLSAGNVGAHCTLHSSQTHRLTESMNEARCMDARIVQRYTWSISINAFVRRRWSYTMLVSLLRHSSCAALYTFSGFVGQFNLLLKQHIRYFPLHFQLFNIISDCCVGVCAAMWLCPPVWPNLYVGEHSRERKHSFFLFMLSMDNLD